MTRTCILQRTVRVQNALLDGAQVGDWIWLVMIEGGSESMKTLVLPSLRHISCIEIE